LPLVVRSIAEALYVVAAVGRCACAALAAVLPIYRQTYQ